VINLSKAGFNTYLKGEERKDIVRKKLQILGVNESLKKQTSNSKIRYLVGKGKYISMPSIMERRKILSYGSDFTQ
jgi:hypothetical protein